MKLAVESPLAQWGDARVSLTNVTADDDVVVVMPNDKLMLVVSGAGPGINLGLSLPVAWGGYTPPMRCQFVGRTDADGVLEVKIRMDAGGDLTTGDGIVLQWLGNSDTPTLFGGGQAVQFVPVDAALKPAVVLGIANLADVASQAKTTFVWWNNFFGGPGASEGAITYMSPSMWSPGGMPSVVAYSDALMPDIAQAMAAALGATVVMAPAPGLSSSNCVGTIPKVCAFSMMYNGKPVIVNAGAVAKQIVLYGAGNPTPLDKWIEEAFA